MLSFNIGTNQPLGILSKFHITLGGKLVCIGIMVFQGLVDFNLLLGHDNVYVMATLVSSLFRVMCFPHEGRIMEIDQILFVGPNMTPNQPTYLNGPYM